MALCRLVTTVHFRQQVGTCFESLIAVEILRVLRSLSKFFRHEIICALGNDVGMTSAEPGKKYDHRWRRTAA